MCIFCIIPNIIYNGRFVKAAFPKMKRGRFMRLGSKRLSDYSARECPPVQEISDLVHDLKLQEEEFRNSPLKHVAMKPQAYDAVKKLLTVGESLEGKWDKLASFEEWRDLLYSVIKPRLQ